MKYLRLFGGALLLVLGLLMGGLAFLTLTETGLQWLFSQVTHWIPGELKAEQVSGRLGKAISLTALRYRTPDFTLEVAQINFAWRPAALLKATLKVDRLHLREVTWRQVSPSAPPEPAETITLPEVHLPFKIRAEDIQVQSLVLYPYDAPGIEIEAITFKGRFKDRTLQVAELGVFAPEGQLQVSGALALHETYPIEVTTRWLVQVPEWGAITGVGAVRGDLQRLTLRQNLQAPLQLQLRGRLLNLLDEPRWAMVLDVPETDLQQIHPPWPAIRLGMNLRGAGGLTRFKVQGSYQLQEAQVGKIRGEFSGEQKAPMHWKLHEFTLREVGGKARFAVHGDIARAEDQWQLFLKGQWQNLAWPMVGPALVTSEQGQMILRGHPDAYRLQVNTMLAGENLPTSDWDLTGRGDTTQFWLQTIQGRLLGGSLKGEGNVRWASPLGWQLQLEGASLNPAMKWPEWPGKLNFSMTTSGTLHDATPAMTVDLQTLDGTLRGYPVNAEGQVRLQNATWDIAALKFRSGASRIAVEGTVEEQLALDWHLISPDLSQLLPTAEGRLTGEGKLRGRLAQPKVALRLQGEKLAYQELRLASIKVDTNLDLEGTQPSRLTVNAAGLAFDAQMLHSFNLEGKGTPSQHALHLAVEESPQRALTLQVQGSWREEVWQGEFQEAWITDPVSGRWEMPRSTPLTLGRRRIELDPWCWQQQAAQICLGGRWQEGQAWAVSFNSVDFPLMVLAPLLPEGVIVEGTLAGDAKLRGYAYQLEQALVQLNVSAGRLIQEMPEDQTLTLVHHGLQVELHLDREEGRGYLEWLLAEFETASFGATPFTVSLRFPPTPLDLTALERLPLDGEISATLDELAFLELLLPEIQEVQGQLAVDLELGGLVMEPQVLGHIRLQQGRAKVSPLGVSLTQIHFQAESRQADGVTFNGAVHSGEGQLALEGQVRLDPAAGWPGRVHIVGDRFQAVRTPEVEVSISPRLQVTLAEHRIQVEGEVTVPKARLSPIDIEQRGGIPISEDVLIVSMEREASPEARGMPIHARVRVILGDKVRVQAYGLTGRIAGSLVVTDTPERSTRGSGELRIIEGQYAAYGVELAIEEGRVIFVGPIDAPRVAVRAVRQVGEVVAGVRVRGPARAPELTLFSEPSMADQNVLAYLILGRPLRTASGEEGQMLASAAVSIGLAGGDLLAQRIGRTFGLERVGIEEIGVEEVGTGVERDPQRAALMLGRHLSPRLYVGYGMGILQRFNVFRMRYLLTESWSLQAETGLESSVDLFYSLER